MTQMIRINDLIDTYDCFKGVFVRLRNFCAKVENFALKVENFFFKVAQLFFCIVK